MRANHHDDRHPVRCMLAALLLVLATIPFAASAACAGKLGDLQSYAGKYRAHDDLLAAPAIAARLGRLPEETRLHLQRNLDVSGPVRLHACHLVLAGNLPHQGGIQGAILDVDLASGTVIAAIHDGGSINIHVIRDPAAGTRAASWNALPRAVREWAVKADSGFAEKHPRSLAQPSSVRLHTTGPAPSNGANASSASPRKIDLDKDAIQPNAAQLAAIRNAAGSDIASCKQPDRNCFSVAQADLNDDGRPDLLVQYGGPTGFCGSAGCSGIIVMATAQGYAHKAIDELPNFYGKIDILPQMHHGMHDLRYGGDSPRWQWNGKAYAINKQPSGADGHATGSSGSPAAPWNTAQAAGHPLTAYAAPIDSTIKHLLVSCQQGRPLLTMLTKQPRPAGPVTLTFVFNGWTLNLPMQRNLYNTNLWMADLSHSDLPEWLAHRGRNATTNDLAQHATQAFLRINGRMQGEISLKNSTAATQAALGRCYRY